MEGEACVTSHQENSPSPLGAATGRHLQPTLCGLCGLAMRIGSVMAVAVVVRERRGKKKSLNGAGARKAPRRFACPPHVDEGPWTAPRRPRGGGEREEKGLGGCGRGWGGKYPLLFPYPRAGPKRRSLDSWVDRR